MENSVTIKLLTDLPLNPKHGAIKDREFEAERAKETGRGTVYWWIISDEKERVGVLKHEAEEVK